MFSDRQLFCSCLLLLPSGTQRKQEEFVHDTRCASISQAYMVGMWVGSPVNRRVGLAGTKALLELQS